MSSFRPRGRGESCDDNRSSSIGQLCITVSPSACSGATIGVDPRQGEEVSRVITRVAIVSVFAASIVAFGATAQAPASARAIHRAMLVTKIKVVAKDIKFKLSAKTA